MTTERIPGLRVFAGPNGSGKTTLVAQLSRQIPLYHIVNPDYLDVVRKGICALWNLNIQQPTLKSNLQEGELLPDFTLPSAVSVGIDRRLTLDIGDSLLDIGYSLRHSPFLMSQPFSDRV